MHHARAPLWGIIAVSLLLLASCMACLAGTAVSALVQWFINYDAYAVTLVLSASIFGLLLSLVHLLFLSITQPAPLDRVVKIHLLVFTTLTISISAILFFVWLAPIFDSTPLNLQRTLRQSAAFGLGSGALIAGGHWYLLRRSGERAPFWITTALVAWLFWWVFVGYLNNLFSGID